MLSLSEDLSHVDGLETITVTAPGGSPVTVPHALRRRAHHSEMQPSGGAYARHDVKWFLSTVDLAQMPHPGDTITDLSGEIYTILEVTPDALAAAWRCRARNLAVAENLSHEVDILVATWHAGPSGAPTATWHVEQANVPARIQPIESQFVTTNHQRRERITHRIYFAQAVDLTENHRIAHEEKIYRVHSQENPSRIDELTVMLAELE